MSISAKIRIKRTVEAEKRIHYNTDIKNGPVTEDDLPKPPQWPTGLLYHCRFPEYTAE